MQTQKQTAAQSRRAALVARLATIRHWLLGSLAVTPVPGTVFDPVAFFLDPSRLRDILAYWEARARRDGCGAGLPRALRAAACEQAAQACLSYFLAADYRRLGVTGDEFARAVLMAYKQARRRFWRDVDAHRDAERERRAVAKGWRPWNRAQNSRTPDPARIVHAADAMGMDPNAVDGRGVTDEVPGDLFIVPGGPAGRGETDGRMECVTVRDIVHNQRGGAFCAARLELQTTETRWRMVRGRGRATMLPPCVVREGVPMPRGRFAPGPMPGQIADALRPHQGDGIGTWQPLAPLPPVDAGAAALAVERLLCGRAAREAADNQYGSRAYRVTHRRRWMKHQRKSR